MTKEIKVGSKTIKVTESYPFRYDYGKGNEVLRIKVAKSDHGYTDIETALCNNSQDISYLEDTQVVNVYKGYTQDFTCLYRDGTYEVELTRKSALELRVDELQAEINAMKLGGGVNV